VQRRFISASLTRLNNKFPDKTLTQGHASKTSKGPKDVQEQSVKSGLETKRKGTSNPMDAASPSRNPKPESTTTESGNKENVGFAEQVGGQSASADAFEKGDGGGQRNVHRDEEAATPGVFSSIKRMLGFGTDSGDVKQNRGGGRGVTGTGTFSSSSGQQRKLHSSTLIAREFQYMPHSSKKDNPTPIDYVNDVTQSLSKSPKGEGTSHNLTHRAQRKKVSPSGTVSIKEETFVSNPRARSDTPHATGEWSTAGMGDEEYKNVGSHDPYEPPSDDEHPKEKEDALQKKLRYGGVSRKTDIA